MTMKDQLLTPYRIFEVMCLIVVAAFGKEFRDGMEEEQERE